MIGLVFQGVMIGIGATVLMDIWAIILHVVYQQPKPNWAPAGRWFRHLANGKVFHDNIAAAKPYRHELALGWIGHYAVGILYGVILALLMGSDWMRSPTFLPAWVLGIVTIGAGWFLMQPGMGLGWAASKTPNPQKVRFLNFVAHTVFALGLYGTALLIR